MRTFLLALLCCACARKDPPPVTPAPPLAADPDLALETMQVECDGMLSALAGYQACPNLETGDVADLEAWIQRANRDFASSRKANPEPNAQKAIAGACRKAARSVRAATERCAAGKRPTP
ncbi:MAG: hypothetical protein M3680_17245 [Myxococcota bacterium]|nr:hypothetical protein [Myxococcota bacterium]